MIIEKFLFFVVGVFITRLKYLILIKFTKNTLLFQIKQNFIMFKDFINLIYPDYCSGCGNLLLFSESAICISCLIDMKSYSNTKKPVILGRVEINQAVYAYEFIHNDKLQKIIHEIKYNKNQKSAIVLGVELGKRIKEMCDLDKIEIIIPVPVSFKKIKKRGYNQSDLIAKGVSQVINKPVNSRLLIRSNNLRYQTKSNRYNRWKNVSNQYKVNKHVQINKKGILLIDDVITSGFTIESCINAFPKNKFYFIIAALAGFNKDFL